MTISVVIVDDHPLLRVGVKSGLADDIAVVAEAASVDEAIKVIQEHRPKVVLLDVHLPGGTGGGGAEVLMRCQNLLDECNFLALSVSDASEDVVSVVKAGARGYLTKSDVGSDLSEVVRAVARGEVMFSPKLAGLVLQVFRNGTALKPSPSAELQQLSNREQEVLRYIARGFSYKEVAEELVISVKTVESHVSSVLRKLQLSSRHELAHWAAQRDIV